MSKISRGLVLVGAGVVAGLGLFCLSSLIAYHPANCDGCIVNGLPYFWTVQGTIGGMVVTEPAFAIDLVFWVAISLTIVLGSYRVAVPYVSQKLKLHRKKLL